MNQFSFLFQDTDLPADLSLPTLDDIGGDICNTSLTNTS